MIAKQHVRVVIEVNYGENNIFTMILKAPEIAKDAKAGQFVMVYLDEDRYLLPRPISLYDVDKAKGEITLVYAVAGSGTKIISDWPVGHTVRVLGPLGNGFELDGFKAGERVALVGGGIGVAPLYLLAKELRTRGVLLDVYLGFRSDMPRLTRCFEAFAQRICVATEDGSCEATVSGEGGLEGTSKLPNHSSIIHTAVKGYVTDLLPASPALHTPPTSTTTSQSAHSAIPPHPTYTSILTCGPIPMLKAVARYAKTHSIPCQVSLEERMACGLGACKACVVKTMVGYRLCCLNGPVFDSKEVNWDA